MRRQTRDAATALLASCNPELLVYPPGPEADLSAQRAADAAAALEARTLVTFVAPIESSDDEGPLAAPTLATADVGSADVGDGNGGVVLRNELGPCAARDIRTPQQLFSATTKWVGVSAARRSTSFMASVRRLQRGGSPAAHRTPRTGGLPKNVLNTDRLRKTTK